MISAGPSPAVAMVLPAQHPGLYYSPVVCYPPLAGEVVVDDLEQLQEQQKQMVASGKKVSFYFPPHASYSTQDQLA